MEERGEFCFQQRVVAERDGFRVRLEEEVERVDRGHVGQEVHRDLEAGDAFGEDDASQELSLPILLPVHEMPGGFDPERVGQDRRAGVGRWTQPDRLRPKLDGAAVLVAGPVGQGDMQRHRRVELLRLAGFRHAAVQHQGEGARTQAGCDF